MVAGITNANGTYVYTAPVPYRSAGQSTSGRQTTTLTIATDQETTAASIKQGSSAATVSSTSYSETVTISIAAVFGSAAPGTPSSQLQSGQQALATVEQTAAEARDFLKNDAKQKLQIALNELRLLKLLGNTPAGAKEAAQLAKQIADAATEYAEGGGASAAEVTPPSSPAANTNVAPAATAAAAPTAANPTATSQTSIAAAATSAEQDPFFQEVQAALAALKKFLHKTLPGLEASPDRKTRKLATEVENSFDESVDQIGTAEAAFNAESAPADGADAAALGDPGSAASLAAAVVAATYQPVNISA